METGTGGEVNETGAGHRPTPLRAGRGVRLIAGRCEGNIGTGEGCIGPRHARHI